MTARVCALVGMLALAACGSAEPESTPEGEPDPEPAAPAAPAGLALAIMDAGIHISWTDASDNEDEFVIQRHPGDGAFVDVATVPFDTTEYHDAPLDAGAYTYRVAAVNADGESLSHEQTLDKP